MTVVLVAAVARDGVIGRDGGIPWRLPEDVARFKDVTTGHAVLMGRRTWESLPERFRPLPGRRNIVLTRDAAWHADGAETAASLTEALDLVGEDEQAYVIGGAEVYGEALRVADELLLTEIDLAVEGDTRFPAFAGLGFVERERETRVAGDGTRFAFVRYERPS